MHIVTLFLKFGKIIFGFLYFQKQMAMSCCRSWLVAAQFVMAPNVYKMENVQMLIIVQIRVNSVCLRILPFFIVFLTCTISFVSILYC